MTTAEYATRTVSLPLALSSHEADVLDEVIDRYNRAFFSVAAWCMSNHSVNRTTIQKQMYRSLRDDQPQMLAQFASIAMRQAAAACKSYNSNNPRARWSMKPVRKRRSVPLDLRLFSVRGSLLTISTSVHTPRIRTMLPDLPAYFTQRYPDAKLNAATLHVSRTRQVSIRLIYRVSLTASAEGRTQVVGIDQGLYKIAVTSKGGEYSGSSVRAARRRYRHNRSTLQRKGTRSAKRRLVAMSGREKRFVADVNHGITRALSSDPSVRTYVVEDLTGIRNPNRRKGKTRTWIGQWAFAELDFMLRYKCQAAGIEVVSIDPRYTSQRCNACGVVDKASRRKGSYVCRHCGHRDNADLNAAKNIRDLHILSTPAGGAGLSQ